jgi:hypothetical protein
MDDLAATLVTAVQTQAWPLAVGAAILLVVYFIKLPLFGGTWQAIPKNYRPLIVLGLGAVSSMGQALLADRPWSVSILGGFLAALAAIGADQVITKPFSLPQLEPLPSTPPPPEPALEEPSPANQDPMTSTPAVSVDNKPTTPGFPPPRTEVVRAQPQVQAKVVINDNKNKDFRAKGTVR